MKKVFKVGRATEFEVSDFEYTALYVNVGMKYDS